MPQAGPQALLGAPKPAPYTGAVTSDPSCEARCLSVDLDEGRTEEPGSFQRPRGPRNTQRVWSRTPRGPRTGLWGAAALRNQQKRRVKGHGGQEAAWLARLLHCVWARPPRLCLQFPGQDRVRPCCRRNRTLELRALVLAEPMGGTARPPFADATEHGQWEATHLDVMALTSCRNSCCSTFSCHLLRRGYKGSGPPPTSAEDFRGMSQRDPQRTGEGPGACEPRGTAQSAAAQTAMHSRP